ncbi:MAG: tyrosine-type recombinase/integrase [Alphaproteobacteria bacterium]
MTSLKSIISEAMRQGWVGQNVAREVKIKKAKRHQKKVPPPGQGRGADDPSSCRRAPRTVRDDRDGRDSDDKPICEEHKPEHLVFPTKRGTVQQYAGLRRYIYDPTMKAAKLSATKFPPHHLRRFYASWLIELGHSPKVVQARLGHARSP